jgi:hypothetical protein
MSWTHVGEKLPAEDGDYLCYNFEWGYEIVRFYQGRFDQIGPSTGMVQYWMPLPKRPQV